MVPWVVLKFGGTSVSGRDQWEAIAQLAHQRQQAGYHVLLVCSAVAGVTNALEQLTLDSPESLKDIMDRHRQLAAELNVPADDLIDQAQARIENALNAWSSSPLPRWRAVILAQGEWLSTRIGQRFLAASLKTQWVNVCTALKTTSEPEPEHARARLSARCDAQPDEQLQHEWEGLNSILITQGFVARAATGGLALLGRGGSDTSAALLGARLAAERVELWTDVPGLYSADPRTQPNARLIPRLAHAEALEMAAAGARVVHGRSIRAAAEGGITLWIRDLANTEQPGTQIDTGSPAVEQGIRAVIHQPDMLVLLLENLDTRQQVGFLAQVFKVISELGVSVDLVATSETTTTLAINRSINLMNQDSVDALARALEGLCRVTVFAHCSGVNLVGSGARHALARLGAVERFFKQQPLLMASLSANDLCLSLLVDSKAAAELAVVLHRHLIELPAAAGNAGLPA